VKAPREAQFRRAEQPGPVLSGHPKAHGRTGLWNLSGRISVSGARERGVKPSTRDDDHRRVEPQAIHSPLNSGKPKPPIPPAATRRIQPEEPAGEKAQAAKLGFSPKARDRTAPPRPSAQQRIRTSRARGKPRSFLARPAPSKQANSLQRAHCVERARSTPDDLGTIRSSETPGEASPSKHLSRTRLSSHDEGQAPRNGSRDVAARPAQGQQDCRTKPDKGGSRGQAPKQGRAASRRHSPQLHRSSARGFRAAEPGLRLWLTCGQVGRQREAARRASQPLVGSAASRHEADKRRSQPEERRRSVGRQAPRHTQAASCLAMRPAPHFACTRPARAMPSQTRPGGPCKPGRGRRETGGQAQPPPPAPLTSGTRPSDSGHPARRTQAYLYARKGSDS
jgi:hypothetical protein